MAQLSFSSVLSNENHRSILEGPVTTESNDEWSGQLNFPGDIRILFKPGSSNLHNDVSLISLSGN
jgi:hypothetical protein